MKKWIYGLILVVSVAYGSSASATIIWSNCPPDGRLAALEGVCPIAEDSCAPIGEHLTECQCGNHGGVWYENNEVGEQCQES